VNKHTPVYNVTVRQSVTQGNEETFNISAPFTRWFDADGFFVAKPFQQWLATEIPIIGQADPKKVVGAIQQGNGGASATDAITQQQQETPKKQSTVDDMPMSTRSRKSKK